MVKCVKCEKEITDENKESAGDYPPYHIECFVEVIQMQKWLTMQEIRNEVIVSINADVRSALIVDKEFFVEYNVGLAERIFTKYVKAGFMKQVPKFSLILTEKSLILNVKEDYLLDCIS